jgi:hydroxypyruvate isomerase
MDRRGFLKAAGLAAAVSLEAQGQAAQVAQTSQSDITTSVVLDMLGGTIDREIEIAAGGGCQTMMMLNQFGAWSDTELNRVDKLCQSNHLTMHGLLAQRDWKKRPVSIVDPAHREPFLADMKYAIGISQKLGITQLVVTSGLQAAGKSYDEQWASLTEGVKRAGDLAGEANFTLLVEPLNSLVDHPGCYLTSCVEGLKLVKEVNHPHVKLLFDIYHEQIMRGNVIRTLTEAMPQVALIHVADNPGRNDPGSGELNFANIYKAIRKTGYKGRIAMEYRPLGDPIASMSKSIRDLSAAFA